MLKKFTMKKYKRINKDEFNHRWFNFFIVAVLFVTFTFLIFIIDQNFTERIETAKDIKIHEYSAQISSLITLNQKLADVYFLETINKNQEVLDLMAIANISDESVKDITRDKLAEIIDPIYEGNIQNEFRQLHFHLINSESFYRAHKPNEYGDSLIGIRDTVEIANTELRFVEGFEEGRIYNGYRFVYPLISGGRHVGSVELSVSLAAITSVIEDSFLCNGIYIIDKEITDEKLFREYLPEYYIDTPIFDGYYIDREVFERDEENSLANYPLGVFDDQLAQNNDFIYVNRDGDFFTNYIFISVKDFNGDHVGYFVFSENNNEIINLMNDNLLTNFLLGSFWLTILLILLYVLNSRNKTYQMSLIDYLTGVNNFKGFSIKANLLFESAKRLGNFWICFIDIDDFKQINDTHGHTVGDAILVDFAKILMESFRSSDVIGRVGGDEFVVCGICKYDECGEYIFKRIKEKVKAYNQLNPNQIDTNLQFSYGFSQVNDYKSVTFEDLLNFADQKMYIMKSSRK